ncbi:MAG TPA: hypothetical protein VF896_06255, partial [Anaerolineales bacterium]
MLTSASRATVSLFLVAFLISSCKTSSSADLYPTYDPFAPVGGAGTQIAPVSVGQVMQSTRP